MPPHPLGLCDGRQPRTPPGRASWRTARTPRLNESAYEQRSGGQPDFFHSDNLAGPAVVASDTAAAQPRSFGGMTGSGCGDANEQYIHWFYNVATEGERESERRGGYHNKLWYHNIARGDERREAFDARVGEGPPSSPTERPEPAERPSPTSEASDRLPNVHEGDGMGLSERAASAAATQQFEENTEQNLNEHGLIAKEIRKGRDGGSKPSARDPPNFLPKTTPPGGAVTG